VFVVETREEEYMVWVDGRTSALVASRYDRSNPPSYEGFGISLNHTPYFDYSRPTVLWGPSSMHPGGVMHMMGDGSVQYVSEVIESAIYVALSTRAGGETIDSAAF
jgi:hypothetical protein